MTRQLAMPENLRSAEFSDGDIIDFVAPDGFSARVKVERIFVNSAEREAGEYPDLKVVRAYIPNASVTWGHSDDAVRRSD